MTDAERYRLALVHIAGACSHANDPGCGTLHDHWHEHIHEPTETGGHRWCGPCVAFRVLAGETE